MSEKKQLSKDEKAELHKTSGWGKPKAATDAVSESGVAKRGRPAKVHVEKDADGNGN